MLGLSTKTIYAISAIYELDKRGDTTTKIKDISKSTNISQGFLEQILLDLKKNSILISVKGAQGGYKLNTSLKKISLAHLIKILEPNYFLQDKKSENQVINMFLENIVKDTYEKYSHITLFELKSYEKKINNILDYCI